MISSKKKYPLLDWFRLVAAILVVSIHTSPLSSFSDFGDFILTRIIARTAVPFFFLVTGFFMGPDAEKRGWRCGLNYGKKIGMIYIFSVFLYLPLNIYSGYFEENFSILKLIKDLFFNGTFYHIWYLPAVFTGILIASVLAGTAGIRNGLVIAFVLYGFGLLGDSYYEISLQVLPLKQIYDGVFLIFDYTRNGLFMAPVFLMEGMWIRHCRSDRRNRMRENRSNSGNKKAIKQEVSWIVLTAGLISSFSMMMVEGVTVRYYELARHDSMYVTLPLVMYFLFELLLRFNRGQDRMIRAASLIIYLIHPWMIVAVRGAAKVLHIEELLIEQSLIYYLSVLASSLLLAALICCTGRKKRKQSEIVRKADFSRITLQKEGAEEPVFLESEDLISGQKERWKEEEKHKRAWAVVDLDAIGQNALVLKKLLPDACGIMAVVKADGYGHGDIQTAKALNRWGINAFGVATVEEGIRLRQAGVQGEILILGYTDPDLAEQLKQYDLSQTIVDNEYGRTLNAMGVDVKVYIGIDTGMHRIGILAEDEEQIKSLYHCRRLKIQGLFSHLCVSDSLKEEDVIYTHDQITRFFRLVNSLQSEGINTGKIHIQASFGIVNYPDLPCHYARAGIALYGVLDGENNSYEKRPNLKPALSLYARIGAVKEIQPGDSVSYGRTFQASVPMKTAAVTIGYADGIPRSLSGSGGWVLLHGHKAFILGRVCMDQLIIDITHIPDVKCGDKVTLIGKDGQEQITCEMFSVWSGTITNEILSRLGCRIHRIYKSDRGFYR